jgi:CYTH domain-containing protein
LVPEKGEPAARVRKTVSGLTGKTKEEYHFNQKIPTGDTGVHQEKEHTISEKEYHNSLKKADPNKCAVEKTRFVFRWHDQDFELDLFKGHLKGLAILELEMDDKDDTVELPPFLKLIKEVTKDRNFTNYSLADKSLKNK